MAEDQIKTVFTGSLRDFPGVKPGHELVAGEILAEVREALAASGREPLIEQADPTADYEDFWEDACRMAASWRATEGAMVVAQRHDGASPRLGPVSRDEEGGHARDQFLAHPLVQEHGGRQMRLAGVGTDDNASDVADWMAERHAAGIGTVVLKSATRKGGIWALPTAPDRAANDTAVAEALNWEYVRLEGLPASLLAQDWVDMTWETRFFAVDGHIVTAAGCVEELTPLDHEPGLLQGRMLRGHHGSEGPSEMTETPHAVQVALGDLARRVAAEHGGTVTIDCALDLATGRALVVELNPIHNSGLYACDHWALFEALHTARDRGY